MELIFVTVSAPVGREIYVNGIYDDSRGQAPLTIILHPGTHVFEAVISVGPDRFVDFRGEVVDVEADARVAIALDPVVPREQV